MFCWYVKHVGIHGWGYAPGSTSWIIVRYSTEVLNICVPFSVAMNENTCRFKKDAPYPRLAMCAHS